MVREAMEAGAAGFSSSAAPTHLDIYDRPVPSRLAEKKEVLALVAEVGQGIGHGSIAFLPSSVIGGVTKEDQEYLIEIGQAAGLPVIIQGLGGRSKVDAPTATWESVCRSSSTTPRRAWRTVYLAADRAAVRPFAW